MSGLLKLAVFARLAEVVLGGVFLAGAVLKALDVNLFVVQISHYGVLHGQFLLRCAALGTLAVESAAGVALVFGWRFRGVLYAGVLALLGVFTGLILYGWMFKNLKDCGCFGPIEISPGMSILKNVVLAVACVAAWRFLGGKGKREKEEKEERRWQLLFLPFPLFPFSPLPLFRVLVCLVVAAALPAYAFGHLEKMHEKTRPFAAFVFDQDGATYDLGKGVYFVAVLNMTCDDCKQSIESLNPLTAIPGFPPVVGLCYEEHEGALDEFRQITSPEFPLLSLGNHVLTFNSLLGESPPPRFYLIQDGAPVRFWDESVPDSDEVLALMNQSEDTR